MHFLSKVGFFDLLYSKFEFPGNSRSREIEIVREIPNPSCEVNRGIDKATGPLL